jgi:hypothetical protein
MESDVKREREFREIIEKRLEDHQSNTAHEMSILQNDLSAYHEEIRNLTSQLNESRSEQERLLSRLANMRIEMESLERKNKDESQKHQVDLRSQLQDKTLPLNNQITSLEIEVKRLEAQLEKREEEKKNDGKETEKEVIKANDYLAQVLNGVSSLTTTASFLETKLYLSAADGFYRFAAASLLRINEVIVNLKKDAEDAYKKASDEKIELDALQLRYNLQEKQLLTAQQDLKNLQKNGSNQTNYNTYHGAVGLQGAYNTQSDHRQLAGSGNFVNNNGNNLNPLVLRSGEYSLGDINVDIPSPLVSEDFNPQAFSLPSSPYMLRQPNNAHQQNVNTGNYMNGSGGQRLFPQQAFPVHNTTASSNHQSGITHPSEYYGQHNGNQMMGVMSQEAVAENEKLKKVIKEVCFTYEMALLYSC